MASVCSSCLRALRQQARRELQPHPISLRNPSTTISNSIAKRTFVSTRQFKAEEFTDHPSHQTASAKTSTTSDAPFKNFASTIRDSPALKQTTEPYIAYGTTSTLLAECSKQITYTIPSAVANPKQPAPRNAAGEDIGEGSGWWYAPKSAGASGGLGLEVTFASWAQVMYLYMYCLTVRLRAFPEKHARIWHQQLLDHFFYAAEDRMVVWHQIETRGTRNKYLKDLWQQWRGVLLSYDEGIIKGDAVLAGAVWRNVFKGSADVDLEDLALVTAFLRGQLKMLDELSDHDIGNGRVTFEDPAKYKVLVDRQSPMMKKGFSNEEMGATKARIES